MSAFSDYLASVDGVAIDVDGNYGPQCWDLWTHYAVNLIGVDPWWRCSTSVGGGCASHPGYTCGIWYGFNNSGLNQWFTPVGSPQRGDVAIWDYGYPATPYSHVAVVVEDRGDSLLCMTQNPGACHYGVITKNGILGYLRPDNQSFFDGAPAPAPAPGVSAGGRTREIVSGDTLWDIAVEEYGDGTKYHDIFAASSFRSGDPNLIYPGEIAVLP